MIRGRQERLGENHLGKKAWLLVTTESVMLAIAWFITLSALFAGITPRLLVASLCVFFILAVLRLAGDTGRLQQSIIKGNTLFLTSLAFAGYAISSALWSSHPLIAIEKGLWLALAIVCVHFLPLLIKQMSPLELHRCARGIAIGLPLGMIYPVFEFATGDSFLSFVTINVPGLFENLGSTGHIPDYQLNANATAIVLFWWPAMMITFHWKNIWARNLSIAGLSLFMAFILYKTQSATAQLAFIIGVIAWLVAFVTPRRTDLLARTLWILTVIGIVPIIMLIYAANMQNATFLPFSFKDRIHIWHYTAKLVPDNPVLGIGIRSSRHYTKPAATTIAIPSKPILVDRPGWHSHNLFLQIWYELGAIGATFLLAIGLLLLQTIRNLNTSKRPFAYALFASFCIVAAVGYGMWQSWLIAAYGWSFIFILISLRYEGYE